ncbi:hypothetical protein [Candidatus Poriferisodalis sp.]
MSIVQAHPNRALPDLLRAGLDESRTIEFPVVLELRLRIRLV